MVRHRVRAADRDAIAQERDYVRDTLPEHAAIVDKVERLREAIDNVLNMHEQWRIKQVLQAALRGTESNGEPPADNGGR